jgi:carboxyl-terminal processing protease
VPRRTLLFIFAGVAVAYACYWRADRSPYARYLAEALEIVDQNYVEPVDGQKLFDGAMNGMVGRLDEYSGFISHEEATRFQQSLDQRFGGIGIEVALEPETEQLIVTTPVPATPAYRAGIGAKDKILRIGDRTVDSIPPKKRLETAVDLLRGKEGEAITLQVLPAGQEQPVEHRLVRAIIQVDSVLGDTRQPDNSWNYLLAGHDTIGYLRVTSFGERTVHEFARAMEWLDEHKCQSVVIDLRNNPGGLLNAARDICEMFIDADKLIVVTKDREGQVRDRYVATGRGAYREIPVVVLVNRGSASASEIVAACLQDQQRAKIVGQRTWGKGTVQHVIPVEGGQSVLRLTTASYWRPSDKNIHRFKQSLDSDTWGVQPDPGCEVIMDDKQMSSWFEQRRHRDVVYPPGRTRASTEAPADATQFDPVLRRGVELLTPGPLSEPAEKD